MLVLPSLHPAHLLKQSDGEQGQTKYLQTVIGDFKKAKALRSRKPDWDESVIWDMDPVGRPYTLFPTLAEVVRFCQRADQGDALLTIDVETTGAEPLNCQLICVGMALSTGEALCLPILSRGGVPYWQPDEYEQVRVLIGYLMAAQHIRKLFHNGAFDTVVLCGQGFPVAGWTDDTLLLHHVIDGELPHALAFCASRYLEIPYWKDEVKGGEGWLDLDDTNLRSYNIRDCLVTSRLFPIMLGECRELGIEQLYRDEVRLSEIMSRATIRGLAVDFERRDDTTLEPVTVKSGGQQIQKMLPKGLGPRLRVQREEALAKLQTIAGAGVRVEAFNPRSPMHLRYLLFDALKFPIVKRTDKGAPSTDKDAMVLLALNADTTDQQVALRALIEYRTADKMLGTWVEGLKVLGDGRFHPGWKVHGTVSGRYSSSPNAQNWNKAIKKIFRAAPGYKFVSVDLSQAELRYMAYMSGDQELLSMYERDINVHTVAASLLFQLKCPPSVTDNINPQTEAYLREACPRLIGLDYDTFPVVEKSKWKPIRTLAKNFAFGWQYGAIPETLYQVIRAKRDPDTLDLLFPDVTLGEIQALKVMREKIHPAIVKWWRTVSENTQKAGFYRCPISGRIQWYRGGFKRNEMLNRPIQSGIASWMNKCMIEIADALDQATGGSALIVSQVHDALTVEAPEAHVEVVKQIFAYYLNRSFALPGIPAAKLPADAATVGDYFDEI